MTACSILSTVSALLLATSTTNAAVAAFSSNDFSAALLAPSPSQRRQLSSSPVVNNGACYRREYYFHGEYNYFVVTLLLHRVCSWLLTAALLHVVFLICSVYMLFCSRDISCFSYLLSMAWSTALYNICCTNNCNKAQQQGMQPTTSSTRLFYKDGGQTTDEGEFFIRSKRTKLSNKNHRLNNNTASSPSQSSTNAESSTAAIKKRKKKKRSYNLHKKKATAAAAGVSITSEELCSHVQSVFSDLKEYENSSSNCDTEEGLDSYQKEVGRGTMKEEQQHDKGVMKQNSIMLDRHPALVLNADYQPLRMLPLSIWSWQDTVKAVLSGKAVVVDIYPDLYVRAVSLDIPVPSVIALREYAPTGKAVSFCYCCYFDTCVFKILRLSLCISLHYYILHHI
jgi:hypothetical protein